MKVSIIIPVYNTECYLNECVDSVLRQTHRNLEVILVNDGSADSSPAICDDYAKKDERVKVIHKSSSGASDARNAGFELATGEYTYFLDSDDFIFDTTIEECLLAAENERADFVFFDAEIICESDADTRFGRYYAHFKRARKYTADKGYKVLSQLIANAEYNPQVCAIFFRTSFIRKTGISFYSGIIHEDVLYTFSLYLHADKVAHINKLLYIYRIRSDSVTTTAVSVNNFTGKRAVFCELLKKYTNGDFPKEAESLIRKKLIGVYASCLCYYSHLGGEEKRKVRADKKKMCRLMKSERYLGSVIAWACSNPTVSRVAIWADNMLKNRTLDRRELTL